MKKHFTDQMDRVVEVMYPPRRIISIVPSQTELLFDLGLDEEVVGLTKFCIHPRDKWKSLPRVGGTKKLRPDMIRELRPDLIIGNKEENDRSQIEELEKEFPVWMSDILTLEDALEMIVSLGEITNKVEMANSLERKIKAAFDHLSDGLSRQPTANPKLRTAYLIWRNPWMAVAGDTFIDYMLEQAGFINVFKSKTRYPEITLEELSTASPDVIMLSSEPYPFKEKHIQEIKEHCQKGVVTLVDGEMFSWYGSRLLLAAPYFANLHKELMHG